MGCVPALFVRKKTLQVTQEVTISIVTLLCFFVISYFFFLLHDLDCLGTWRPTGCTVNLFYIMVM